MDVVEKFFAIWMLAKENVALKGMPVLRVEFEEVEKLEEVLPVIWDELSPEARAVIDAQGVVYTDEEAIW